MQPTVDLFKIERDSVDKHVANKVSKVILTKLNLPKVVLTKLNRMETPLTSYKLDKSKLVASNQISQLPSSTDQKYGLRTRKKIHYNDLDSVVESQEALPDQTKLMTYLDNFFRENNIPLKPRSPVLGDGNCFFRSIVDQILLHSISSAPTNHQDLRLAVCDHIQNLPEDILNTITKIIFNGKKGGLVSLARRQRRLGRFVDDSGIMVLTTALYLGRNIHLYSNKARGEFTAIDGGEGAEKQPPITVFYFREKQHYQSGEVREKNGAI